MTAAAPVSCLVGRVRRSAGQRLLVTGLALLCGALALAADTPLPAPRIVAVGDVHGSYDGLTGILRAAELIDDQTRWVGGTATLVQVGDLLDRGLEVREVMDLLMRLQGEAAAAGGRVVCLLGNHEAMNLLGILRDANPDVFGRFADSESKQRRAAAFEDTARVWRRRAELFGFEQPETGRDTRRRWYGTVPLGVVEYLAALGPEGRYGRWLRTLPVAFVADDTLFVHGGFGPALAGFDVAAVNRRAASELASFDRARAVLAAADLVTPVPLPTEVVQVADEVLQVVRAGAAPAATELSRLAPELTPVESWDDWYLVSGDGPLWYRGATGSAGDAGSEQILDGLGLRRMVIGHTPSSDGRIESRLDGRVLMIDTGMLASVYPAGRPAALELRGDAVTAIYEDRRVPLGEAVGPTSVEPADGAAGALARPWRGPDGTLLPFASDAEVLDFLRTAEVVSRTALGVGITNPVKLLLERDGVRANAVFKDVDEVDTDVKGSRGRYLFRRDYHGFDVAAFELDRLLGLHRVPPAVMRTVDGRAGTVQLWIEGTITNRERRERELTAPDPVAWARQEILVRFFDVVIDNTDRNLGNILIDDEWRTWFIDHSRAFTTATATVDLDELLWCERGLWQHLQQLDEDEVRRRLAASLKESEIEALLSRRRAVVEHFTQRIADAGEDAVLFDLE